MSKAIKQISQAVTDWITDNSKSGQDFQDKYGYKLSAMNRSRQEGRF